MDGRYEVYNSDLFKMIDEIETGSIDLILTDPPYNLSSYSTGNMKFKWRKEINNDLARWDQVDFRPSDVLVEFKRILKPTGNLLAFCSYNLMGEWHKAFDPEFDTFQFFVWHKTNPIPKFRKAGFLNSCELVVCCWNKGHTWNFGKQNEMHNHLDSPICMGRERVKDPNHPTQKPLRVLKHLIKIGSNEKDVVFDPFMGVGSTGVASLELGRRFIGIEIDETYFKAAEKRIKNVPRPLTDF
ncbi:MAG: site-specific DNA-methyltransferase [Candidatus Thermoplasmatota archaeon]|nr:site-specific DNA-methyltransferase [Candidatus Thermoplasmatota archaeon]